MHDRDDYSPKINELKGRDEKEIVKIDEKKNENTKENENDSQKEIKTTEAPPKEDKILNNNVQEKGSKEVSGKSEEKLEKLE